VAPSVQMVESRPWADVGDLMVVRKWRVTDEDAIDGVELVATKRPGHYVLAHRTTYGSSPWQATWFDEDGPGGDLRRATLEEALNEQSPPSQYKVTAIHLKGERVSNPTTKLDAQIAAAQAEVVRLEREYHALIDKNPLAVHFPSGEQLLRAENAARKKLDRLIERRERAEMKGNPAPPVAARAAVDKYREFHQKDPKRIGEFGRGFAIPTHVLEVGDAKNVLYRSDKLDPETLEQPDRPINYIHDHDPGVCVYEPCDEDEDDATAVPYWIGECEALVLLGTCLGFAFQPDGGELVEARVRAPRPELYTTPCGRALLVIQSKRKVLAMMWGGSLGVEDRGIVG
jgi:hypothetical protein